MSKSSKNVIALILFFVLIGAIVTLIATLWSFGREQVEAGAKQNNVVYGLNDERVFYRDDSGAEMELQCFEEPQLHELNCFNKNPRITAHFTNYKEDGGAGRRGGSSALLTLELTLDRELIRTTCTEASTLEANAPIFSCELR